MPILLSRSMEQNLDPYYENLHNYVRMVTEGYSRLLMLDAKGGLGKTWHVRQTLDEELEDDMWVHQKGFTTPIELFKTLWKARSKGSVLFLDDMSGVTSNQKAIDMLKAATDTEGDENWVQYRTSQDIEHPFLDGVSLPNTFCFNGRIVMSFNRTPDNHHFNALKDRGTYYNLSFNYQERLDICRELAKKNGFSNLSVEEQIETAEWIADVTDASHDVTIRTFEEVLKMREFSNQTGAEWEKMAYEVFDMNWKKHRIIELREAADMPVEQQVEQWCEETGLSETKYYDLLGEIKNDRS